MKLAITLKDFKNNIIGYFNTNKQKNLLEDLNYTYKFLFHKSYAASGYIIFNDTKRELKSKIFSTNDNISLNNTKVLGSVRPIYSSARPPQDNIIELGKFSNPLELLDSYTDIVHIYSSMNTKIDNIPYKYRYNGKNAIEFKLDSYSASDSIVTIIFIYKDILYAAEQKYSRTSSTYTYGNGFDEWFDNNFKE